MNNKLIIFLFLISTAACNQHPSENKSIDNTPKIQATGSTSDSVINKSFAATNGEKFLRFEMQIDTAIAEVWKAFTTEAGIKTWMTPVVTLDFKVGGEAQTHYDKNAKIGDKGTIALGIINYLPNEMLTYKVKLNEVFPEKCRNEDKNLQEVIQFKSVGDNKTKVIATMLGWGEGKEWNETYSFFEKGNKWSYEQLIKRFHSGPLEWK